MVFILNICMFLSYDQCASLKRNFFSTMRYHLTPMRITCICKLETTNISWGMVKKNPHSLLIGMSAGPPSTENNMNKNEAPFALAIPNTKIIKKIKNHIKKICTPMFSANKTKQKILMTECCPVRIGEMEVKGREGGGLLEKAKGVRSLKHRTNKITK